MPDFTQLLAQGAGNAWFFIPSAILLGALHGLEPGHSKTMMAAFIVAVRGTVSQALLLGLAATISHTLVVWLVALAGLHLFRGIDPGTTEPYFQLASAVVIIAIAGWMLWRTWHDRKAARGDGGSHDDHRHHSHDHATPELSRRIDTGHGLLELAIVPDSPAHFRLRTVRGRTWPSRYVTLVVARGDGAQERFAFRDHVGFMESVEAVAAPFDFAARIHLAHGDHAHGYEVAFGAGKAGREAGPGHRHGLDDMSSGGTDAHARAHADAIRKRFAGRDVTTWQIVLFGLTGGLIPCPAAITVLLLCIQLKEFTLGAALVLCFSIGLALTLMGVGVAAAIGVRHATKRIGWLSGAAARAPYFSGALIVLVGLYTGYQGWRGLHGHGHAAGTPVALTQSG